MKIVDAEFYDIDKRHTARAIKSAIILLLCITLIVFVLPNIVL